MPDLSPCGVRDGCLRWSGGRPGVVVRPKDVAPRRSEDSDKASGTASDPAARTDICTDECTGLLRVL